MSVILRLLCIGLLFVSVKEAEKQYNEDQEENHKTAKDMDKSMYIEFSYLPINSPDTHTYTHSNAHTHIPSNSELTFLR